MGSSPQFSIEPPSKGARFEVEPPPRTAVAPPERPGFLGRFAESMGLPSSLEEAGQGLQEAAEHPLRTFIGMQAPVMLGRMGANIVRGISEGDREAMEAGQNIAQGGPIGANLGKAAYGGVHGALSMVPMAGPTVERFGEDIATGNYGGAVGGGLGLAAQIAGPKMIERGGMGLRGLGNATAERLAQSMLGPEPKDIPPVSRPAPALVKESPIAMTRKGLIGKVNDALSEHQSKINDVLEASKSAPPERLADVVNRAVEPEIARAEAAGYPSVAKRIAAWRDDYLKGQPEHVALDKLYGLRKKLNEDLGIFQGRGATREDIGLDQTQREVYREMNRTLDNRMPGFRDITERESGLMNARGMLQNKERVAAGQSILPMLHLYVGEGEGGGMRMPFVGGRLRLGMPEGTLLKTGLIRALGQRIPLATPNVATAGRLALPAGTPPLFTPPPEDVSFVRGEPAETQLGTRAERRGLLLGQGRRPLMTEPPSDVSFVRGEPAISIRREPRGLLRPAPVFTPPPEDVSRIRVLQPESATMRDPKTGRMKRIYLGTSKE